MQTNKGKSIHTTLALRFRNASYIQHKNHYRKSYLYFSTTTCVTTSVIAYLKVTEFYMPWICGSHYSFRPKSCNKGNPSTSCCFNFLFIIYSKNLTDEILPQYIQNFEVDENQILRKFILYKMLRFDLNILCEKSLTIVIKFSSYKCILQTRSHVNIFTCLYNCPTQADSFSKL